MRLMQLMSARVAHTMQGNSLFIENSLLRCLPLVSQKSFGFSWDMRKTDLPPLAAIHIAMRRKKVSYVGTVCNNQSFHDFQFRLEMRSLRARTPQNGKQLALSEIRSLAWK